MKGNWQQNTAIIILAGGSSARMGSPKQLLPWNSGTLLEHAIDEAVETKTKQVVVVLGANHQLILSKTNRQQVHFLVNENWESGMGSSISTGVRHITQSYPAIESILLMLCDQPAVNSNYLSRLIEVFQTSDRGISATEYNSKPGVPAVFDKCYFSSLMEMTSTGAKKLMKNKAEDTLLISPGFEIEDIDTKEDYERMLTRFTRK